MRARNIKPAFFQNELLAEVDPFGRLLFIGLWTLADREGRLEDRPRRIKMQLFALDDVDVDALLTDLEEREFLARYTRDGGAYIQIVNFKKHQRPHNNESESVIPPSIEEQASNHGSPDMQPRPKALRSESPFTDCLNADTGMLNAEDDGACAPAASADEIELSPDERRVIGYIQQVRGASKIPTSDIALHLREVLSLRASDIPGDVLCMDALRFRDYWNGKREKQSATAAWKGWRAAVTNWFSRTSPSATVNGRASPVPRDNVAASFDALDRMSAKILEAQQHEHGLRDRVHPADEAPRRALPPASHQ